MTWMPAQEKLCSELKIRCENLLHISSYGFEQLTVHQTVEVQSPHWKTLHICLELPKKASSKIGIVLRLFIINFK